MSKSIPTPADIDVEFLTRCLREAGHASAQVKGFSSERVGTGQIGQCIRYGLELEDPDADTPRSLIGKFPSDDPTSRQTGIQLRAYLKEVSFYRDLQSRLGIRTPKCYFAEIEGEGPEQMLLLEDLAPAEQGDQLLGCSPEVAQAAVLELVGLHAPSWCDASLRTLEWLGEPNPMMIQLGRALYSVQLEPFMQRFEDRLEADEAQIIRAVAESKGPPFALLGDVFSLVHVDYRLDNILINEAIDPPSIAVVDWQGVTLGHPLADVAYFIGAGLLPETRKSVEEDLVRGYHDALQEAGVSGYSWQQCWTDYRRGAFAGFAVTVVASVMVQQTERGDEMFTAMARRHALHALDLGAEEFLAG